MFSIAVKRATSTTANFQKISSKIFFRSLSSTSTSSSSSHLEKYPHIFQSAQFGNITVRNRIIMGSMHTGLEEGKIDQLAAFYAERAKGEVGIIVTGGISPNTAGQGLPGAAKLTTLEEVEHHKPITKAVHDNNGRIVMQILHTGRYAKTPALVAPSPIPAPINRITPRELTTEEVYQTIQDYANCAVLAQKAGYDGVEIMGSEGYLINQFLVRRTNHRTDEWGGDYNNRIRFPIEIVKATRQAVGPNFIIIYRLSMIDLVEDGSSFDEIKQLGTAIRDAGASIINTGIGWHETTIPTIATMVPRASYTTITQKIRKEITEIPFCTSNRINTPEVAEKVLSLGHADFISMARPLLADSQFIIKAKENRSNEINTCIGCNQACLDHIFAGRTVSCLVNPKAGHEHDLIIQPTTIKKSIAIVGGGPAGLAAAVTAAERGHDVTLYEKDHQLGGQFNIAKLIPGKEEFYETIRYFQTHLKKYGVKVHLNTEATVETLAGYDAVVLATGVYPRHIDLPIRAGTSKVKIVSYLDVLKHKASVGQSVAIIGAGGIGYDVGEYITETKSDSSEGEEGPLKNDISTERVKHYFDEWGIDNTLTHRGGLKQKEQHVRAPKPAKQVFLLQRKKKFGSSLGKTTGWIHRAQLKKRAVQEIGGVTYVEVNDEGLVIDVAGEQGKQRKTLPVDTIIICAGQVTRRDLFEPLKALNKPEVFLIGGSLEAAELDAKRAIDQGTRLAAKIEFAKTGEVFEGPDDYIDMHV